MGGGADLHPAKAPARAHTPADTRTSNEEVRTIKSFSFSIDTPTLPAAPRQYPPARRKHISEKRLHEVDGSPPCPAISPAAEQANTTGNSVSQQRPKALLTNTRSCRSRWQAENMPAGSRENAAQTTAASLHKSPAEAHSFQTLHRKLPQQNHTQEATPYYRSSTQAVCAPPANTTKRQR